MNKTCLTHSIIHSFTHTQLTHSLMVSPIHLVLLSPTLQHCFSKGVLGGPCQTNIDCSAAITNSECNTSHCVCVVPYVTPDDLICVSRRLGDACTQSSHCSFFIQYAICINSTCNCPPGFTSDMTMQTCTLREIGSSCQMDLDCSAAIPNSMCSSSFICTCNHTFYASPNRTSCIRHLLGKACAFNWMCYEVLHARCTGGINNHGSVRGTCECVVGYYQASVDGDLCEKRVLGQTCMNIFDCGTVEHAQCVAGVCICPGTKVGNNTCLSRKCNQLILNHFLTFVCAVSDSNPYTLWTVSSHVTFHRVCFQPLVVSVQCHKLLRPNHTKLVLNPPVPF